MGKAEVQKAIASADSYGNGENGPRVTFMTEPPRPLVRELPPADPFPIDALGPVLSAAAESIEKKVRAPLAICGQSVLATATLAAQCHADVELPTGQCRPISAYFLTVAESGARKTACDDEALWPVNKHEARLREQYEVDLEIHQRDLEVWEKQKAQVLADKKAYATAALKKQALIDLGSEPQKPLIPMITCPEPTFEGLCLMSRDGQGYVGIFSSEGGQFIGGHGMTEDNRLKTAAGLSTFWDKGEAKRVRAGDGASIISGKRISMHLMMQPDVGAGLLSDDMLKDQGLLSRVLTSAPDSTAGTRLWREMQPGDDLGLRQFGGRILQILETPRSLAEKTINELVPRALPLSPAARQVWISYTDHIERNLHIGGPLDPIRGLANKLPEHAARIAAVLAIVADIGVAEISSEQMSAGVTLAEHYSAEALRLFEAGRVNSDLRLAQKALSWMRSEWKEQAISLPDLYQFGPSAIRDGATASKIASILEDHGWLVRIKTGGTVRGVKRREVFGIVRADR